MLILAGTTGLTMAVSVGLTAAPAAAAPAPDPGGQWWFTRWQIPRVWALGARGQGVTVAVLDSGVDGTRPELAGRLVPGLGPRGPNGVEGLKDMDSDEKHGTAMARLIVGRGSTGPDRGLAPEAKVMSLGETHVPFDDTLKWAVDHGAKVINMSFGSWGECNPGAQLPGIRYAVDHGAIVVAAAGNNKGSTGLVGNQPANCPGVLAVGAVDIDLRVPAYSTPGDYVSAAAPGDTMINRGVRGQVNYTSGTSNSAALTSAAVALVWSKYPKLTNSQILARLLATARDAGPAGRDDSTGYGVIRPYQAITADVPLDAPDPITARLDAVMAPHTDRSRAEPAGTAATQSGSVREPVRQRAFLVREPLMAGLLTLTVALLVAAVVAVRFRAKRYRSTPGSPPPTSGTR